MLKETLHSILSQTYKNIEIFVISDASEDDTVEIVKNFKDERIHYYRFEKNQGLPAKVRNWGLLRAKGEFIAFCDDDDLWNRRKLEHQISVFKEYPAILLTCSRVSYFPKRLAFLKPKKIIFTSKILVYKDLLKNNSIFNSSVLMRSLVLEKVGLLDESPQLKAVEDYDYWLRVLKYRDKSIYKDHRKLVRYRFHWGGISRAHLRNGMTRSDQIKIIFNKHYPQSKESITKVEKEKEYYEFRRMIASKFMSGDLRFRDIFTDKRLKFRHRITFFFTHFFDKYFTAVLL